MDDEIRAALAAITVLQRRLDSAERLPPPLPWARLWELFSADPPVSPSTFVTYGHLWDAAVAAYWGSRDVASTTHADVATYRAKRRGHVTKRGGRPVRPATRNREVMLLRSLASWGVKLGHLVRNPLLGLDDAEDEDNVRETIISEEMFQRIVPWLPPVVMVFMTVVIDSGLRRGEAAALKWNQIDLKTKTIFVSRRVTKARKSRYTFLSSRAEQLLINLPRFGDNVFANPETGNHFTPNYFLKHWRAACDRAGVRGPDGNVTIHDGRHTWASRQRRAGTPDTDTMHMGGWSDTAMLMRYNIVEGDDIAAARSRYEAHLRQSARHPAQKSAGPPSVGLDRTRGTRAR